MDGKHAYDIPRLDEDLERILIHNLLSSDDERVFFKDLNSRFIAVSAGYVKALADGLSVQEVVGRTDFDIFSRPHAVEAFEDERHIIRTGEAIVSKVERETFTDRPDTWVSTTKFPLRDESGEIIGTFGISRDVTAQVEAQEALAHQALRDPVTGLANRVALMDRLSQALVSLERRPARLAVLFLDLDNFKTINDTLGHEVGDHVLSEIGRRLQHVARRTDTVARFGGDEFVVLCSALHEDEDVRLIGDRVMHALRKPLRTGRDMVVTASLGAVVTSDPMADAAELLQQADLAMYAAKRAGRNRVEFYDAALHGVGAGAGGLVGDLLRAIERSELFVVYQPLYRLDDGTLTGIEALVRWRHPERGVLSPADFIPIAEQYGAIGEIDAFVLDEACRQLAAWTSADSTWSQCTLAVNMSGRQLRDPTLVQRVLDVLSHHRIAPSQLCLEITETAVIGDLDAAQPVIEALTKAGVRIALDDFGTGYSTLAHLQRLRADILKIDRSFVAQLGQDSRDREIVAAVTAMAHALGMTVVGEGVETAVERQELTEVECDEGQGFLFSAPLLPAAVARLWSDSRASLAAA